MRLTTALILALLAGCATTAIEGDSITYATAACYGTCPVYTVTIAPDGRGTFEGQRHTAITGTRPFTADPADYRRLAALLAPYRPQGERVVDAGSPDCGPAPTDMPSIDVRWSSTSGASDHLNFYYGCGAKNRALADALRAAPGVLPIAALIGER